jgi:hypothetical protein
VNIGDSGFWQPDTLVHNNIEQVTISCRRIISGTLWCWNSNRFICSKFSSFAPEWLQTTLFQSGCLAFSSPASSDLSLKLKSSVTSASFLTGPRDRCTIHYSLLPIGMQTPVASPEASGGRRTWLSGMPFLTATAVPSFLPTKLSVR